MLTIVSYCEMGSFIVTWHKAWPMNKKFLLEVNLHFKLLYETRRKNVGCPPAVNTAKLTHTFKKKR